MNATRFKLMKFDMESMLPHAAIVMIARRGSGKSWVCRDILYHLRHIPGGVVIAPTDKMNSFYKHFFPDLFIHYDFESGILNKVLTRQALMLIKEKEKAKRHLKVDPSGILIMDDCLASKKKWSSDENISTIMMNGRHYKLTYILTMQTPLGITPDLRLNFDYVFLLKEDSAINIKKLWDNYASMFPSMAAFDKVFKKCTSDHNCMVIDNRKATDTIQEKVFWYLAEDRKFAFGSKEFINIHKKYYDPNYQKKEIEKRIQMANTGLFKKKNEINIEVEKIVENKKKKTK